MAMGVKKCSLIDEPVTLDLTANGPAIIPQIDGTTQTPLTDRGDRFFSVVSAIVACHQKNSLHSIKFLLNNIHIYTLPDFT